MVLMYEGTLAPDGDEPFKSPGRGATDSPAARGRGAASPSRVCASGVHRMCAGAGKQVQFGA